MSIINIHGPKGLEQKKAWVTRITLLEDDGSETVINITDEIHFLFGFSKVSKAGEPEIPMELIVVGDSGIIGEIYYQAGNLHPELIAHCVRRSTEAMARKVLAEIKRSGVDPIGEALKKMPTPEAKGGWN